MQDRADFFQKIYLIPFLITFTSDLYVHDLTAVSKRAHNICSVSKLEEEKNIQLDLQSAGSSPNLSYTKISARDAIRIL